jgi:hypothetical protein
MGGDLQLDKKFKSLPLVLHFLAEKTKYRYSRRGPDRMQGGFESIRYDAVPYSHFFVQPFVVLIES